VWFKARPEAFPFRIVWRGAEGSNRCPDLANQTAARDLGNDGVG
jgi:hypothetical protein